MSGDYTATKAFYSDRSRMSNPANHAMHHNTRVTATNIHEFNFTTIKIAPFLVSDAYNARALQGFFNQMLLIRDIWSRVMNAIILCREFTSGL